MKRGILITSFAATLLLVGCNTEEDEPKKDDVEMSVEDDAESTDTIRETDDNEDSAKTEDNTTESNTSSDKDGDTSSTTTDTTKTEDKTGTEKDNVTSSVEQPEDEKTTNDEQKTPTTTPVAKKSGQVLLFEGNSNADGITATKAVDYSFKKNGSITKYIIDQLGYTTYYNKHTVSADEKTVVIDFNDTILSSPVVQGSAGSLMFQDSLLASLFDNIPTAQTVKFRINGEEVELDHINFSGQHSRADFESRYPGLLQ